MEGEERRGGPGQTGLRDGGALAGKRRQRGPSNPVLPPQEARTGKGRHPSFPRAKHEARAEAHLCRGLDDRGPTAPPLAPRQLLPSRPASSLKLPQLTSREQAPSAKLHSPLVSAASGAGPWGLFIYHIRCETRWSAQLGWLRKHSC